MPGERSTYGRFNKRAAGREMTEIGFLKDAGAIAFTDFNNVVRNSKILSRALSYAKSMDALVIGHPQDPDLQMKRLLPQESLHPCEDFQA